MRSILALALTATMLAAVPAMAQPSNAGTSRSEGQTPTCPDQLDKATEGLTAVKDAGKKATAIQEIALAKDAQTKNDLAECIAHATKAVELTRLTP